jgi:cyclopropane fatty-acyl-phospholipid synthase-like methyltransferase
MRALFAGLVLLAGCAHRASEPEAHPHGVSHHQMPHRFEDAESWAEKFEAADRDAWQQPAEVIAALKLGPEAVVADIGAATGYFPVRLARALPKGRVYGVDIEKSMVDYLSVRAVKEGLRNLHALQCTADDAALPEPVDLVLLVNTYHHIEKRPAYFKALKEKLLPGGRVAIIDFRKGQPMGPPEAHRIDVPQLKEEFAAAGYSVSAEHSFLPNQYFLVFTPSG